MQQLTLHLLAEQPASLDNFVLGPNHELGTWLETLRAYVTRHQADRTVVWDRQACPIYLWGASGCGKSHLAQALTALLGHAAHDDVHLLDEAGQDRLFAAINSARAEARPLVALGNAAPRGLPLRDEVRSRLSWGLVLEIKPLKDADKALALQLQAQARGWDLEAGVLDYILTHTERDMRALSALMARLDALSMRLHRGITIPLVRQALGSAQGLSGPLSASPVE